MAVMMRSMLEVADNSGARKLQMILPLGGSTGLNAGLGDIIHGGGGRKRLRGPDEKGSVVKAVIVAHPQGNTGGATAPTSASTRMPQC